MFTATQLVAHLVGDYLLQSDWMASEKTKRSLPALCHVATYGIPFLLLSPSLLAMLVILSTHFCIDRFRLARYVGWIKNGPWHPLTATGYGEDRPVWLAVWLLIITDNIMHVLINGLALHYL